MANSKNTLHVGLILDGNRRWAKAKGLSTLEGHAAGHRALKNIIQPVKDLGITHLSVYVFSTENWKRAEEEVNGLMGLFREMAGEDIDEIHAQNVRVRFVGTSEHVDDDLLSLMRDAEEKTKDNTEGTLAICFNYGSQQEIADACKTIVSSGVGSDSITPDLITQHLYEPNIPPLDLVVRTSGEMRLSNFMLWQAAYAELFFTDTLWPDFDGKELSEIIDEYNLRSRRFGQ